MIKIKSPTRVDLAGGTLDMWPLYNFTHGATTINVAIDIWTRVELTVGQNKEITIESLDLKQTWSFKSFQDFKASTDSKIMLYQSVIFKFEKNFSHILSQGFSLKTQSESPIGGGLGGSSSLVISLLKAFAKACSFKFKNSHEMVHWAHNIEAEILNTPTGTQDYYPAIAGGLNELQYSTFGIEQKILETQGSPLYDNFLLIYTGRTHHSGLNNFEVLKSAVAKDQKVMGALQQIKIVADHMQQALEAKNWSVIPELFQAEYKARIQLTPAFTSPEIEKLHEIGLSNGAEAVKICGAGGGGCVLIWVKPAYRQKVIEACEKEKFQSLNARPVSPLSDLSDYL